MPNFTDLTFFKVRLYQIIQIVSQKAIRISRQIADLAVSITQKRPRLGHYPKREFWSHTCNSVVLPSFTTDLNDLFD